MDNCIECDVFVGDRQEAVSCDSCDRWQHRKCNTGITRAQYRRAVKLREDIPFLCKGCDKITTQPMVQAQLNSTSASTSLETFFHDVDVGRLSEVATITSRYDETLEEIGSVSDLSSSVKHGFLLLIWDWEKLSCKRHLIFATDEQLNLLRQARRWYIDGTFQVMRRPFHQLLSIHAFVRRGDCSKQIPMIFIAMSGRSTQDYVRVLKAIHRGLAGEEEVEEIVADFEAAIWKAIREVFPAVTIKGCFFHWGQALFRRVQSLGLATEYMQHGGTHALVGMLFVLPFLPKEHIIDTFTHMDEFNNVDRLQPLFEYVRRTWIESTLWPVESWCVYGQSIRTNNDVEGWHRRLNLKGGVAPAFYNLVKLLHREGMEAGEHVQLVGEMRLRRLQRKAVRTTQSRIFAAWESYRKDEVSSTGLLKLLSGIYRPRLEKKFASVADQ